MELFCACESYPCYFGEAVVGEFAFKPIFMHNPIGFLSFRSSPSVENKGLLHSNKAILFLVNFLIFSCSLPVPRFSRTVSSHTSWIFPISLAKEIPFILSHLCFLCSKQVFSIRIPKKFSKKIKNK